MPDASSSRTGSPQRGESSPSRTGSPQRGESSPARQQGASFRAPLWLRWVLSLAVAAGLVVALILFVQSHSSDSPAPESPAAAAEANRETEILVAQDQSPHTTRLNPGAAPAATLERAIAADMNYLIAHQVLDGPLQSSKCGRTDSRSAIRLAYSCTALADNVNYPFVGVVDVRTRQVTYCKHDPAPIASENVPLSPRCFR